MKTLHCLILMLLVLPICSMDTGRIAGYVSEQNSHKIIIGAQIKILNYDRISAISNQKGLYYIDSLAPGVYAIQVTCNGYVSQVVKDIRVKNKKTSRVEIRLNHISQKKKEDAEEKRMEAAMTGRAKLLGKLTAAMDCLGGGMMSAQSPSKESYPRYNTEEYARIKESGFYETLQKPLSTFAADVDGASYANARRFIQNDQLPYADVVRIEEFINYFDYDYRIPEEKPLSINLEYSQCPWNKQHHLVHIGLQGKKLEMHNKPASNLVFLLDVSGSMNDPKKLPLLKKSFRLLIDQLSEKDRVSIVVYAGNAGLVLPATSGDQKGIIGAALNKLQSGGSTAGGKGIQLAYQVASANFIRGGNNRVILATDGDFNVGISSTSELVKYIEQKKESGIFLTVLGFGMGNYKDYRLQELADRGNGNHAYIDNILEAKKVLVNDLTATLFTIAKDVKIQVEFNPVQVKSYRLIGYENRKLEDKDFKDDKKDAGEVGAGHTVTALYEIVPADDDTGNGNILKYQDTRIKNSAFKLKEVLTVQIRYKEPEENTSKEISAVLTGKPVCLEDASNNFRFSAAVAQFAMILRNSKFREAAVLSSVQTLAKGSLGQDPFGYRAEFISLLEKTELLKPEYVRIQ